MSESVPMTSAFDFPTTWTETGRSASTATLTMPSPASMSLRDSVTQTSNVSSTTTVAGISAATVAFVGAAGGGRPVAARLVAARLRYEGSGWRRGHRQFPARRLARALARPLARAGLGSPPAPIPAGAGGDRLDHLELAEVVGVVDPVVRIEHPGLRNETADGQPDRAHRGRVDDEVVVALEEVVDEPLRQPDDELARELWRPVGVVEELDVEVGGYDEPVRP